ncbi:MAG: hypothetical protein M3O70_26805 [Actinomycetota bacterium]|nr:hypothetical protein [Actinomycetota bacterium]
MSWPGWLGDSPGLSRLVEVAEEEARERGHDHVEPHHLALALTRDGDMRELLERLGLWARIWRDYINFILGFNAGLRSAERQRMRPGAMRHPQEIYYSGALQVRVSTLTVLEEARHEADRSGVPADAPHLLVALMESGYGGIGAGTARWLGLTPTAVRQAANLSTRQPSAPVLPEVGELPRPRGVGPLVLLGGGPTPAHALQTAVELARGTGSSPVRIALVNAALGRIGGEVEEVAQRRIAGIQAAVDGVEVVMPAWLVARALTQRRCVRRWVRPTWSSWRAAVLCGCIKAPTGTPALEALVDASDRGAVVVGYSAGTQVLGAGCLEGWEAPQPVPLLGWLGDFVIEPHCSGEGMQAQLRCLAAAFPGCRGLRVAHGGAVLVPAGWSRVENLVTGYDDGSIVLEDSAAAPHRLATTPFNLGP